MSTATHQRRSSESVSSSSDTTARLRSFSWVLLPLYPLVSLMQYECREMPVANISREGLAVFACAVGGGVGGVGEEELESF